MSHDIGRGLTLEPLDAAVAASLAADFARMPPWSEYPYPAEAIAAYLDTVELAAPRHAIHSGGVLAGAVGIRLDWLRGPYLQFLGILPSHQGSGTGRAVLAWFETEARRAGSRNLWVAVSDFNGGAIRFYERHGFRETARIDGLVQDGKIEILMRKRLA